MLIIGSISTAFSRPAAAKSAGLCPETAVGNRMYVGLAELKSFAVYTINLVANEWLEP